MSMVISQAQARSEAWASTIYILCGDTVNYTTYGKIKVYFMLCCCAESLFLSNQPTRHWDMVATWWCPECNDANLHDLAPGRIHAP